MVGGWWLVVGGWWLVVGGWWLVVGGVVVIAAGGMYEKSALPCPNATVTKIQEVRRQCNH